MSAPRQAVTYGGENQQQDGTKEIPTLKGNAILACLMVTYVLCNLLASYIFIALERQNDINLQLSAYHDPGWFVNSTHDFLSLTEACITTSDLTLFVQDVELALEQGINVVRPNETTPNIQDNWTMDNAFLLSFTIASTIGYGSLTPVTPGGQLFCIFFAFISIPFTGLLAAKMGWVMAYYIKQFVEKTCAAFSETKTISVVFTLSIGAGIYIILPTILLLFINNTAKWTFFECLYCVIISLTTIGFGDYVPDPSAQGGMMVSVAVLVWVVAGLAWLASIVNIIATTMTKHAHTISRKAKIIAKTRVKQRKLLATKQNKQEEKPTHDEERNNRSDEFYSFTQEENNEQQKTYVDMWTQTEPHEVNILGPSALHAVIQNNMERQT